MDLDPYLFHRYLHMPPRSVLISAFLSSLSHFSLIPTLYHTPLHPSCLTVPFAHSPSLFYNMLSLLRHSYITYAQQIKTLALAPSRASKPSPVPPFLLLCAFNFPAFLIVASTTAVMLSRRWAKLVPMIQMDMQIFSQSIPSNVKESHLNRRLRSINTAWQTKTSAHW